MHPRGQFYGGEAQCGCWREVSVGGGVFTLRESRSAQQKGNLVEDENNILKDGTLIDRSFLKKNCTIWFRKGKISI